jgi:GTP-binding protein EngB required for normal cell division
LVGRKALARTSKTPGRTQTINFYALGAAGLLVDLRGTATRACRLRCARNGASSVGAYVRSRASLVGVVVLVDARHPLTPLDRQLLAWLGDARKLVLLAKADKLTRAMQATDARKPCARICRAPRCCFFRASRGTAWKSAATCSSVGSQQDAKIKAPGKGDINRGEKRLNFD